MSFLRRIPGPFSIAALVAVALLVLAACGDDEEGVATPTATVSTGAITAEIKMVPTIRFDQRELTIAANTDVIITADNSDTGVPHNFSVYRTSAAEENLGKTEICGAPCTESITLNLPPGEYFFRCDVHPQQMTGTLIVQ